MRDVFVDTSFFIALVHTRDLHHQCAVDLAKRYGDDETICHTRSDKEWSLTDCYSFELMKELGVSTALTADRHFEQAGFETALH